MLNGNTCTSLGPIGYVYSLTKYKRKRLLALFVFPFKYPMKELAMYRMITYITKEILGSHISYHIISTFK